MLRQICSLQRQTRLATWRSRRSGTSWVRTRSGQSTRASRRLVRMGIWSNVSRVHLLSLDTSGRWRDRAGSGPRATLTTRPTAPIPHSRVGRFTVLGDASIELFEYLADDPRGFVSGEGLATFGRCDLRRKVLDRMHSPDQDVAKSLSARFRIIERLDRRGDRVVRRGIDGVNERHRLLATVGRRDSRLAVRILLVVPLAQRLVIAAFARMEKPSARIGRPLSSLRLGADRCVTPHVVGRVLAFRNHRHEEGAVGISYDVHESDPPGILLGACLSVATLPIPDQSNLQRHRSGGGPAPVRRAACHGRNCLPRLVDIRIVRSVRGCLTVSLRRLPSTRVNASAAAARSSGRRTVMFLVMVSCSTRPSGPYWPRISVA